jgi:hypothetical protein
VLFGGTAPSVNDEVYSFVLGPSSSTSTINRNDTIIAGPGNAGSFGVTGITVGAQGPGTANFTAATFGCVYLVGAADSLATQKVWQRAAAAYYAVSGVA